MKIIKRGDIQKAAGPERMMVGTCKFCGCKIECRQTEAHWMDEDRPGSNDGGHVYDCPTCKGLIWLRPKRD